MLTLTDCLHFSGITEAELALVAHHEHLPPLVALEKAHAFLQRDWGEPALRQMVLDEVRAALLSEDPERARAMLEQLQKTFTDHPGGIDRRIPMPSKNSP
ncbi:hypothetical protein [Novispirillum itersonii]|uniref:hypothetical protein n=1 Tax=Novispirillum itersonii TaxID=189 RepID=UPI00036D8121|nr:hypothetical protein [Novispirillum itersonii]